MIMSDLILNFTVSPICSMIFYCTIIFFIGKSTITLDWRVLTFVHLSMMIFIENTINYINIYLHI